MVKILKIFCYQNMPDYDDEYIDPELKADLEEAARLRNPNNVQPSLEKQECCLNPYELYNIAVQYILGGQTAWRQRKHWQKKREGM